MPQKSSQIYLIDHPDEKRNIDSRHPNTPAEQHEIAYVTEKLNDMYDDCQVSTWHEFRDRSIKTYCDENEERINSYVPPREDDIDAWQTNGYEGITREKMFAFVAKTAMNVPQYKFKAVREDDFVDQTVSDVMSTAFKHSWWQEDPIGVKFLQYAWRTAGHGTSIIYEGIKQEEVVEYDYEDYDLRTGQIMGLTEKVVRSPVQCMRRFVHPVSFLWDDMYGGIDVQDQIRIGETQSMSYDEFMAEYGDYYKADQVPRSPKAAIGMYDKSFHQKQWASLKEDDLVYVTHFRTKERGRYLYRVLANGVMILCGPGPRKDRMYPYATAIYHPHGDTEFVLGKALPDEIADDQDLYNAFKNMVLDRSILYVNRPIITDAENELYDQVWGPNKILTVKGTRPQPLDISPVSDADFKVLQELRAAAARQSSDQSQSGQAGSGSTAREIVIADENARMLMGISRKFLEFGDWQAAKLRVGDIAQFYFDPIEVNETLTKDQQDGMKAVYRKITLDNETLSDGRIGTRKVEIVPSRMQLKSKEDLDVEEEMARMQGYEVEPIQVTASYLRRFQRTDVMIIPESSYQKSKVLDQANEVEYQKIMAGLYPTYFAKYQDVFFRDFNKAYDRDMGRFDRVATPEPQAGAPGAPGAPGAAPGAPGAAPAQIPGTTNPIARDLGNLSTVLGSR